VSVLRKAASDPAFLALMAGTGGAGLVTQGAGLLDLVRGETHGLNSGEIPLNYLISYLAGLPPGVVAAASVGLDPVLRESISNAMDKSIANDLAKKGASQGVSPDEFLRLKELTEASKQTPAMDRVIQEQMNKAVDKGSQAMTREQILKNRLRRGGLATLGAAGIGSVPAILAMKDQPAESLPVG
tara:strand:- start:161 stop:715 length:555 start_codon:yes stop_codon:yes gene_type:complete